MPLVEQCSEVVEKLLLQSCGCCGLGVSRQAGRWEDAGGSVLCHSSFGGTWMGTGRMLGGWGVVLSLQWHGTSVFTAFLCSARQPFSISYESAQADGAHEQAPVFIHRGNIQLPRTRQVSTET